MLFSNTIHVPLRPVSLPLSTSIVLNGISKYHSGIIATGKCTIENFKGIEWYSIIINGITNTIQVSLRLANVPLSTSVTLTGIVMMNGISKYHSGIYRYHCDQHVPVNIT